MTFLFAIARLEARNRRRLLELRKNKYIKATICVLNIPEERFIKLFRVDKATFKWILCKVQPHFTELYLSPALQLAAVLRFLVTGSYQLIVEKDFQVTIGRSTFGKVIHNVIPAMERELCAETITLQMTKTQVKQSREHFYGEYQLPRIVACLDGFHIRILKPVRDETAFMNDNKYFSINAMLLCNYNMEILAIDATHPGSCSDAYVWNNSQTRQYLSGNINCHYVLADSAYALENFVLTPYRSAEPGSLEHRFNEKHAAARAVTLSTIGLLKSRFRCIGSRYLNYDAKFVVSVVNVCCALHNICCRRKTPLEEEEMQQEEPADCEQDMEYEDDDTGVLMRNEIAATLL